MKRDELDALLALLHNDHRAVATRIVAQWAARLDDDEDAFLRAHLPRLDFALTARWLAFRPENPAAIVDALAEKLPAEAQVALWHLLRERARIDDEVWAHVTEALRPRLAVSSWRMLHAAVRGCALHDALLRAEYALDRVDDERVPATAALLSMRYDERACRAWVLEAIAREVDEGRRARLARVALDAGLALDSPLRALASTVRAATSVPAKVDRVERSDGAGDELAALGDALGDVLGDALGEEQNEKSPVKEQVDAARLAWLAEHGAPRRELVAMALEALASPREGGDVEAHEAALLAWIAQRMTTRSAWEELGATVLAALIERYQWDLLGRLCGFLEHVLEASGARPVARGVSLLLSADAPPAWMPALHEALGLALLGRVRRALERGEHARAEATLEAMVYLTMPPRSVRALRSLRDSAGVRASSAALLELHVQLCRRSDTTRASMDGVLTTLREVALLEAR